MSARVWKDVLTLPALPKFTKLAEEFGEHADGFKKIFDSVDPHREPLPGHWDTDLDDFQKMLVLKCIRADKLTNSMQVCMGKRANTLVQCIPVLHTCMISHQIYTATIHTYNVGSKT